MTHTHVRDECIHGYTTGCRCVYVLGDRITTTIIPCPPHCSGIRATIGRVEAADIAKETGGNPEVWDTLFGLRPQS